MACVQGVAEAESRRAADAAEAAYRGAFDRGLPPDEGRLEAEHARALAVAQAVVNDAAVGAPAGAPAESAQHWGSHPHLRVTPPGYQTLRLMVVRTQRTDGRLF